jgi:hypothetical protein
MNPQLAGLPKLTAAKRAELENFKAATLWAKD